MKPGSSHSSPETGAIPYCSTSLASFGCEDQSMMVELVIKADGTFVMISRGPVVEDCYTVKKEHEARQRWQQ